MMKPRTLEKILHKASRTFPAMVVTGPRQSGKTTLLKQAFAKTHRFVSLEDMDVRIRAKEDPRGFLEMNPPPVILDEIQYAPDLLSYVKTRIDEARKPGQWLLTGSQNFALMQGVTESLAGRAAVLSLLPFTLAERIGQGRRTFPVSRWLRQLSLEGESERKTIPPIAEIILRGQYPEIASKKAVPRNLWCSSYITTYLERDVRGLSHIGDLSQFEIFLKQCAIRTGQILNMSEIAKEIGVSVPTIRRWISVLETGYQVYLLYPYYRNLGKRLVKSPKIYFTDTALASHLLGLDSQKTLFHSPHFGHLFETFVVTDILKRFFHFGERPSMYYLRTRDGLEVDLVLELGSKLYLFEIKSAMTMFPKHSSSLSKISRQVRSVEKAFLVSQSTQDFRSSGGVYHLSWQQALC